MICQCQWLYDVREPNQPSNHFASPRMQSGEIPYLALLLIHHCGTFIEAGKICNKEFLTTCCSLLATS
ncbi:hypothetical protein EUGRSUZ_C01520 [Eucalyptus grandis]|uniref:Uncharacterized protein n=2 Tax=Eucalyptus grandis TaxID=71139 RepID=A0ACC3LCG9_EUCGR|nr:hypothetical protein EUGRSUZ_C01520 [Eucalyptus grandis]